MKIEVGLSPMLKGQNGRLRNGELFYAIEDFDKETMTQHNLPSDIIKVANTPQELIQVGDLVFDGNVPSIVEMVMLEQKTFSIDYIDTDGFQGSIQNITKIFTPNEDKSVYTEQWSKDE